MGLDGVELVMEMEETFGIVIEGRDAVQIETVGQAYRYILGRVELRADAPCPSATLFYRLRRNLLARSGVDRSAIRPSSRIDDFLPFADRRAAWVGLGDGLGVSLPRLVFASWQRWLVLDVGLACGMACLVVGLVFEGVLPRTVMPAMGVLGLTIAAGSFVALRTLTPFASTIPQGCETIRGIVLATLGRQPEPAKGVARTWHPDEVWATLRELISEQLGVAREEVTEEKHFVYDFGMD
jgi:acyl carrier protein